MDRTVKHLILGVGIGIVLILFFFIIGETFGAEPNPTGNPIGGGQGYTRIISPTDTRVKYVVSTRDQLLSALKSAQSGEVIFLPGNAEIDLTGTWGHIIPAGVTLASDRGRDGSLGARIFRYRMSPPAADNGYSKIPMLVVGGDNVRITGLRLEGGDTLQDELFEDKGIDVKSGIEATERKELEVDNCELQGWSYTGVKLSNSNWSEASAYIHHNYIHHCQARGYGYGVVIYGGKALIEANLFDYTRHAISATGFPGESYEARYNIHLGHGNAIGGHHFDVHAYPVPETNESIAGYEYKIHHNTFELTSLPPIGIRAVPEKGVWIDHNKFQISDDIFPVFQRGNYPDGVFCGFGRIYMTKNFIGYDYSDPILYIEGPVEQI
jgi:hypothetical protein